MPNAWKPKAPIYVNVIKAILVMDTHAMILTNAISNLLIFAEITHLAIILSDLITANAILDLLDTLFAMILMNVLLINITVICMHNALILKDHFIAVATKAILVMVLLAIL